MNRKSIIAAAVFFLFSFGLRLLYAAMFPGLVYHGDSVGYIEIGRSIFLHPSLSTIVNPFRNPGYPIFLSLNENIFHTFSLVPFVQFFIASISLSLFFLALVKQKIPLFLSFFIALCISLSINVFGWEKSLMTEGLATSWLLLVISLTMTLIDSFIVSKLCVFLLLSTFGFFLRPMVTPIPIIILIFLILHHTLKQSMTVLKLWITTFLYIAVPILYILGNTYFHGYKSIQQVGDVDVFARILQFKLPVDAGSKYPFFTTIAKNYAYDSRNHLKTYSSSVSEKFSPPTGGSNNIDFRPFDILKTYDPEIFGKQEQFNELRAFNKAVIYSNPMRYVSSALSDLPRALTETSPFLSIDKPIHLFSLVGFFYILQEISRIVTYGHFLMFFILPIAFVLYIRSKTPLWLIISLLSTIILSQLLIGVLVVYEEYARLYAVTYPLMIASVLLFFYKSLRELRMT